MDRIKIIFLLLISINYQVLSQENKICGEIQYSQTTHFSRDYERQFSLKFNGSISLYKEENILKRKEIKTQNNYDNSRQTDVDAARNNTAPEFYYNDLNKFYFRKIWDDEELLVIENPFEWNWVLDEETKIIGHFICQKATIKFRGRNYIAWFAKDIPVPFGPWKFQRLPGLILEIYDEDIVFHIRATDIEIYETLICKIDVNKNNFNSPLTIKGYLKKIKELNKEYFAKLSSKLPKGYGPLKMDENCDDCSEDIEIFDEKNK